MEKERLLKKENGITLIALVITIVVMLILAGVTINLTLGENGIFTTAQKATQNYTSAQEQELSQLSDFTDGLIAGKVVRTANGVQYIGDGVGNLIPVPVGFSYLEGTKLTGFVIKNNTDGNEFVWVPVGSIANYKRVGWKRDGWDKSQTLNDSTGEIAREDLGTSVVFTEAMSIDERDSISAYGGFYIGRYESGIVGGAKGDTKVNGTYYTGTNQLVVQKGQQVWNYIEQGRALTEATNLYNKKDDNVISKLCSSYAWDSALKFIEKNNKTYPTNSIGGNYKSDLGVEELKPTGYHAVNNIYDMGGNTWEWTTESASDTDNPCVDRGGYFRASELSHPSASRGWGSTTYAKIYIGFRVTLYL